MEIIIWEDYSRLLSQRKRRQAWGRNGRLLHLQLLWFVMGVVRRRLWRKSRGLGLGMNFRTSILPSISLVFQIYFLVWVEHCSGKEIISTFCFCWLICRNTETHILLNNTNNLHLKFICLVPWRPAEQNVCNKYSCAGDTIALEKTKTWSLVQEAYSPNEVREKFWETWLPVWVCFFPNVPCPFLMVWLCSCWFFFSESWNARSLHQPSKAYPGFKVPMSPSL